MNHFIKLIALAFMQALLVSCTSMGLTDEIYVPNETHVNSLNISLSDAKNALMSELPVCYFYGAHSHTNAPFDTHKVIVKSDRIILMSRDGSIRVLMLGNLPPATQKHNGGNMLTTSHRFEIELTNIGRFWCSMEAATYAAHFGPINIADALFVVNAHAKKAIQDFANEEKNFHDSVNTQHPVPAGTPLPQKADMYRVQAEYAVRNKHFDEALALYAKSIDIAPWWAQGHFNRGLLYAEMGDYGFAISEMDNYLSLQPDAPNAKTVRYKVYEWQAEFDKENTNIITQTEK